MRCLSFLLRHVGQCSLNGGATEMLMIHRSLAILELLLHETYLRESCL